MLRRLAVLSTAIFALCLVPIGACGGDDDDDDDNDSSGSYSCCLNGEFFDCPSSAAVSTCSITTGAPDCSRDSSRDSECS